MRVCVRHMHTCICTHMIKHTDTQITSIDMRVCVCVCVLGESVRVGVYAHGVCVVSASRRHLPRHLILQRQALQRVAKRDTWWHTTSCVVLCQIMLCCVMPSAAALWHAILSCVVSWYAGLWYAICSCVVSWYAGLWYAICSCVVHGMLGCGMPSAAVLCHGMPGCGMPS